MKNFKRLVAVALTVVMLCAFSTTIFAAVELDYENEIEFSATVSPVTVAPGEDITVTFYMKDNGADDSIVLTDGGTLGFDFDINDEIVTYKSVEAGQSLTESFGTRVINGETYYTNTLEASSTVTIDKATPIMTYVFTVNADVANGSYDIITAVNDPYVGDGAYNEAGTYVTNFAQVTVKSAAQDPTYTGSATPATYVVGDVTYKNVWTGDYTVKLNGNDITKVGLRFTGKSDEAFAVAKSADGEGSVSFKIAIVGAPTNEVATPIVYAADWIAAVAQ